jgi:hypothetical protein
MFAVVATTLAAQQEGVTHDALHAMALNQAKHGNFTTATDLHKRAIEKAGDVMSKQAHRWTPTPLGGEDKTSLMNVDYVSPKWTHPDGESGVLYTNAVGARHNKEGVYLPPKKFNYSPARTRDCCIEKCKTEVKKSDCEIGCKLWMGASSLNWESKSWHTKLRAKCDRDVAAAETAEAHAERVRAHNPKFKSYYETLGYTPTSTAAAQKGCDAYLVCMYALESTAVATLPADNESRVTLDLDGKHDGVVGDGHVNYDIVHPDPNRFVKAVHRDSSHANYRDANYLVNPN